MIERTTDDPPKSFFWGPDQQSFGKEATEELIALVAKWRGQGVNLEDGHMQPHSQLRNVPK